MTPSDPSSSKQKKRGGENEDVQDWRFPPPPPFCRWKRKSWLMGGHLSRTGAWSKVASLAGLGKNKLTLQQSLKCSCHKMRGGQHAAHRVDVAYSLLYKWAGWVAQGCRDYLPTPHSRGKDRQWEGRGGQMWAKTFFFWPRKEQLGWSSKTTHLPLTGSTNRSGLWGSIQQERLSKSNPWLFAESSSPFWSTIPRLQQLPV